MSVPQVSAPGPSLNAALSELRPKLHRFCARMTGSAIDGEDIVQEVCVKAIEAQAAGGGIENLEAWLFRIAHNAALDFLRRRSRERAAISDEATDMIADPTADADRRLVAAASLRAFMELSATERSSVILMDVLGYHLDEIGFITGLSIPAIKAALHRGRASLPARPTTGRGPCCRPPKAPGLRTMRRGSTRGTSTPSATCWPMISGSSWSTAPG